MSILPQAPEAAGVVSTVSPMSWTLQCETWTIANKARRRFQGYKISVVASASSSRERIEHQKRALQAMTTHLEERERIVNDLSELNEMNWLLITRYQEYEDREAEVDDDERRRYMDQIDRLEQQLEDRRLEYGGVSAELQRLRRDRDDYHDEARAAEAGLQRRQDEVTQREGVIARHTDQVDKIRGDSVNQRIKLDELRGQRTALRKEVQE